MSDIKFDATANAINDWTIVQLPQAASTKLPSRGQVMVMGTINGVPFQDALEPDGKLGHWLNIDSALQKSAKITVGDTVSLEIEATKDWPEPTIPADIQAGLADDPKIKPLWSRITPMARWEWIRWINSTANPATRANRIEVSASKLSNGERRPCCFNRNMCCVPQVSKSGILLEPALTTM